MNINVPYHALDHFWEEPPAGSMEFWSFQFRPPCQVGDKIIFRNNGQSIAEALVAFIEPPGRSACETTGRFRRGWKVFWHPDSFKDLRSEKLL
jgi:hypothetical protein